MLDILLAHPAANLVGIVCVALGATWPLYKTRSSLLWAQVAVHGAFSLHFYLLEAFTGSIMNALGGVQAISAIPLGTRPGFKIIYLLSLPLIALGAYLTWQGWPSVFSSLALALFSLARYQSTILPLRLLMMLGIVCWTVHDVLVMSIPGLSADALSLTTSLWMIFVEHRKRLEVVR
ncbi:YgjV family protein [Magnetovibrio blakemorei]|uniref:YgjV family protein n=1 Tax=Magnetovibrio blakemorei TaxID=28181 RepID=A0A1E5Q8L3_9PROT|nr:YgjV family protein [Magnetovibrio blakemorei]OEJ67742.1 hypothetical protein BEN30_08400 [Magnetovibrio blakemorei]